MDILVYEHQIKKYT